MPAPEDNRAIELEGLGGGVWRAPGARVIDKTMLAADVLESGYAVTFFCRPRRFGETLNMTMMRSFFESPEAGGLPRERAEKIFGGTEIWEAEDGRYQEMQGSWPVVHLSMRTAKGLTWENTLGAIRSLMSAEYLRHD